MKNELFVNLVNVAMADEYSDFDGNEMPGDISYFQNCDDQNVQVLFNQVNSIQDSINTLMNLNSIQDDELGIEVTEI